MGSAQIGRECSAGARDSLSHVAHVQLQHAFHQIKQRAQRVKFVAMRPQLSGRVDATGLPPVDSGFKAAPGRAQRSLSHPCLPDLKVQSMQATRILQIPGCRFLDLQMKDCT